MRVQHETTAAIADCWWDDSGKYVTAGTQIRRKRGATQVERKRERREEQKKVEEVRIGTLTVGNMTDWTIK